MSPLTRATVLIPHPDVFLREEGEPGGLLYDANSGRVRLVNGSAASFWKLLDGRRTLEEVERALGLEFEGFDEAAASEVSRLAEELIALGLVAVAGPGSAP